MKTPAFPNVTGQKLVHVYTSNEKNEVMTSYFTLNSRFWIVIFTTAFRMGIDCANIRNVIHWALPSTKEKYVQPPLGKCERDHQTAESVLYRWNIWQAVKTWVFKFTISNVSTWVCVYNWAHFLYCFAHSCVNGNFIRKQKLPLFFYPKCFCVNVALFMCFFAFWLFSAEQVQSFIEW